MARQRGSVTKLSRNSGGNLDGCPKVLKTKKNYPSGQHGQTRRKLSEYAMQLAEKQRVRNTYGLLEKQFRNYYEWSVQKKGVTGTLLLQRLESRFDNVLYRSGLVKTRRQGRQLIVHGHFLINGQKVDRPSFIMKPGDVITVREKSKKALKQVQDDISMKSVIPGWLNVDENNLTATYMASPEREDIDQTFNEQLIIEYYSR